MLVVFFPYYAINPGVLSHGHESLKDDCLSCHSIAHGAASEKCITCHNHEWIGKKLVSGALLKKENQRANLLHKNIREIDCVVCHREHTGESKTLAIKKFSHDIIGSGVRDDCNACHGYQKSKVDFHKLVTANCSGCHTTNRWHDAKFNHDIIGKTVDNCAACHEHDKPSDALHANSKELGACSACHSIKSWKPSSFDHKKHFVFDKNHPATCINCHATGKNFKTYTCYNCHEHSYAEISGKHLEEGIPDFSNCVKCHRSSKGEVKSEGNRENKKEGGRENKRESRERDDD
jgi:hypothetical protein